MIKKTLPLTVIFFIVIFNCSYLFGRESSLPEATSSDNHPTIVIDDVHDCSVEVSPLFFGANSLYWVNDDESRDKPELLKRLKSLKLSTLRYPGGEVADNFDWETNKLNDDTAFPKSRNINDPVTRMDFDEFITWKDKIGAKAILVVNLENGFIERNLEEASDHAAQWVRYANIEKRYNVRYWEIGNESYHFGTRYALTSKEYSRALKLFSRKMKAVDPSIKIGAIGPYNLDNFLTIDALSAIELASFRSKKTITKKKKFRKQYKKKHPKDKIYPSKWWSNITKHAGESFDFAVIHRYTAERYSKRQMHKPLQLKNNLNKISHFLEKKLHKKIPLAVTEYNVANTKLKGIRYGLTVAEMIGNCLESRVFLSNYWPLRSKNRRALLGPTNFEKKTSFPIFKAFSKNIGDKLLHTTTSDNMLYVISSMDTVKNQLALFIINKSEDIKNISLSISSSPEQVMLLNQVQEINKKHVSLHALKVPHDLRKQNVLSSDNLWAINISALSLTILKFKSN